MPAPCVLLRNFVSVLFARARSAKARAVLFQSSERVLTGFCEALGVFWSTR